MATAAWIKNLLEQRGVAFEEVHDQMAFTAQETLKGEPISGHRLAKVVVALINGRPVVLILPTSRRVVLGRVQKLLGADHVHLASEDEMEGLFTDGGTGAIPPQRHGKDLEVLMDTSLSSAGALVFPADRHHDMIRLKVHAWFPVMNPRVEFFTEPAHGPHRVDSSHREAAGTGGSTRAPERRDLESRREPGREGLR
jgi:prolyl-tRNA editing enzyme YbaK/EbsC (Cys-tRNA(Pro) deacylase)